MPKAIIVRRDEAANIINIAMLKLRKLGDPSNSIVCEVDQPKWLINLQLDLWKVIKEHLPVEFGV